MIILETPDALIEECKKHGVKLSKNVQFDPETPLLEVSSQFNGEDYIPEGTESDFGFMASVWGKKFDRKFKKAAKGVAKVAKPFVEAVPGGKVVTGGISAAGKAFAPAKKKTAITSFNIPKNVNPVRALASADKLLGSASIKPIVRQQIINNTKALAALGDPNARRAITTLNAAQQIRRTAQVPVGKAAVTAAKPLPTTVVKKEQPKSKVLQLAQKQDANLKKLGVWARFKIWLVGEK
jgi:hypothetical protein